MAKLENCEIFLRNYILEIKSAIYNLEFLNEICYLPERFNIQKIKKLD